MTLEKYFWSVPIALVLFVLSYCKNLIICRFIFARNNSADLYESYIKRKTIVFACLSDIVAFLTAFSLFVSIHDSNFLKYIIHSIVIDGVVTLSSSTMLNRCIGVFVGMLFIFIADYFIALGKGNDVSKKQRLTLSAILAVATAPYLFLIDIGGIIRFFNYGFNTIAYI